MADGDYLRTERRNWAAFLVAVSTVSFLMGIALGAFYGALGCVVLGAAP